nr:PBSX family phage terminase large subunit [Escherichia coli]
MTSINPIFEPFIEAHRYKVAKGGRGSGKSWAIARLLVEAARRQPVRILCARELQNSISDSVIRLLEDTIEREGYSAEFEIQRSMIRHLGTNAEFMFYGIKNNPTKIKSLEGIDICWVEEAEAVTKESWDILIPTIRKPFSEIWVSFNPKNILDDTYQRFVVNPPDDICLLTVNYTDNPHFPEVLRLEMEECKRRNPTLYRHIWLGEPVSASDMAIIKREWLEAATDAHKKLGWKAKGAVVSAHDPSDTGPDAKGYASRHGSVVKRIAEGLLMDINEGADWATSLAIEDGADHYLWDGDGVGAGLSGQMNNYNNLANIGLGALQGQANAGQTYANNMSQISQQSAALAAANANRPSALQQGVSGAASGALLGGGIASALELSTPWGAGIGAGLGLLGSLF